MCVCSVVLVVIAAIAAAVVLISQWLQWQISHPKWIWPDKTSKPNINLLCQTLQIRIINWYVLNTVPFTVLNIIILVCHSTVIKSIWWHWKGKVNSCICGFFRTFRDAWDTNIVQKICRKIGHQVEDKWESNQELYIEPSTCFIVQSK